MRKLPTSLPKVQPGNLVLTCDLCVRPVTRGQGFVTVKGKGEAKGCALFIYHDDCAHSGNVVCGELPGVNGGRSGKPFRVNTSRIATADLLLTTLATLAGEMKSVNWLQLVQRIMADTEYYFDADGLDGGNRTAQELVDENLATYASAGLNQHLKLIEEAEKLEAKAESLLNKAGQLTLERE